MNYYQHKNGYAEVPILDKPRHARLYDYIIFVEQHNYKNFTSVDEQIIKRVAPYETDFYWNHFQPIFAHYLTEFTKILLDMKVIKDYLPVTQGFRSPQYAKSLCSNGKDSFWTPHRAGIAVDILCIDDIQRDRILAEADAFGFGGLGRGQGYCHIDIAGRSSWGYNSIEPYIR